MGLNKTSGNMYSFVSHTLNFIKGQCPHDCSYCHPADTQILMANFSLKVIADVKIGDAIIGLKKTDNKGFYKFTRSYVVDKSQRLAKTLRFVTTHGVIRCTPEHPLMGSTAKRHCTDWKAARSFSPYENIRYLPVRNRRNYSLIQRLGYLKGIRDGDGCVISTGKVGKCRRFEIVCVDKELSHKIKTEFKKVLGIDLRTGIKKASPGGWGGDCPMLLTSITKDVLSLESKTKFQHKNTDFAKGYLAGMLDTDGSVACKSIRISQSKTANREKYNNIMACCVLLGLAYIEEEVGIRIKSNFKVRCAFLFDYGVYHSKKAEGLLLGYTVKGSEHSMIQEIAAHSEELVFNLQTECENFIANGFVVHNCYMKRFKQNKIRLDTKEFKTDLGKDNFIFIGSSVDMFAAGIKGAWIGETLEYCRSFPDNKYLFQSKNPIAMLDWIDEFPANSIIGTTIETNRFYSDHMGKTPLPQSRADHMRRISKMYPTMLTIEPIMAFNLDVLVNLVRWCQPQWVNVGADSQGHNLPEPTATEVEALISELKKFTEVKVKKNLRRLL
jgi:hypothetical protein